MAWYSSSLGKVRRGLVLTGPSVVVALSGRATRGALGRTVAWIAGAVTVAFVAGHLTVLPVRMLLWIVAAVLRRPDLDDALLAYADDFIHQLAVFWIPFVLLLVLRNIWTAPLDELFLVALSEVNPVYGRAVAEHEPLPLWTLARRSLRRWARTAALAAAVGVVSWTPFVGWLATPLAIVFLTVRAVGPAPALALVALPVFFPWTLSARTTLSTALACQSLMRELVEPFVTRAYQDERVRRRFFEAYGASLTAFAAPFAAAMSLPLIGPIAFVLAQAAIAVAIDALHNV